MDAVPGLTRDENGLALSGDIRITMVNGTSPMFVWPDAIAFGLMIDSSLRGNEYPLWEIHSTVGFSSVVTYGELPQFAQQITGPVPLIPGRRYFVSVYGTYPRYGIQEFEL